jgi:thiosulfate dehydrogenase
MTNFRSNMLTLLSLSLVATLTCCDISGCDGHHVHAAPAADSAISRNAMADLSALANRGKLIFDQTPKYASGYVGNKLACSDCHIHSGTAAHAAPMVDLAGLFPMFNKRAGHVISLQNRIQECFARSEAGQPPPENSAEIQALVAYIDGLSRNGVKGKAWQGRGLVKVPALTGNPAAGKAVYAAQCAGCHGSDGAGVPPVLPPLWGSGSYNDGAGMNNPAKMTAFVLYNMPQNHPGTLTPQEAWDVSAYIHTKARPKFNQAFKNY